MIGFGRSDHPRGSSNTTNIQQSLRKFSVVATYMMRLLGRYKSPDCTFTGCAVCTKAWVTRCLAPETREGDKGKNVWSVFCIESQRTQSNKKKSENQSQRIIVATFIKFSQLIAFSSVDSKINKTRCTVFGQSSNEFFSVWRCKFQLVFAFTLLRWRIENMQANLLMTF